MKEITRRTLFQQFQCKKTPSVPYFCFLYNIKPQPYLILAFSMKYNPSSTLFQYFQWKKTLDPSRTLVVPYFNIFNNIRTQPYIILGF